MPFWGAKISLADQSLETNQVCFSFIMAWTFYGGYRERRQNQPRKTTRNRPSMLMNYFMADISSHASFFYYFLWKHTAIWSIQSHHLYVNDACPKTVNRTPIFLHNSTSPSLGSNMPMTHKYASKENQSETPLICLSSWFHIINTLSGFLHRTNLLFQYETPLVFPWDKI